jgi:hypothetical protein
MDIAETKNPGFSEAINEHFSLKRISGSPTQDPENRNKKSL